MPAPKPPAAGAAQPGPGLEQIPNLRATVTPGPKNAPVPTIVIGLHNAGISTEFQIYAEQAPMFFGQLGQAVMQAVQAALAAAPPRIVTPNGGAGGLFLPNGAKP